jgi:integral membrane protein (TIGR01906 family)
VELGGQRRPLFNERELAHMEDVQAIMQLFFRLQTLSGVFLAGFLLLGVFVDRAAFLPELGRLLLLAAGLTIGLALLVGLLALTSFSELFLRFHQVAFRNDLWQLDPTRDYLIMLFPEPFWFDATLRIALLTGLETAAAGLVGFLLTRVNVGA